MEVFIKQFLFILILVVSASASSSFAATGVTIKAKLSPAGSFEAVTSDITGTAIIDGQKVSAKDIKIPLDTLKTSIDLRDRHMREKYLETEKFPHAELIEASGENGKGSAKIRIRGFEKDVAGTYELLNSNKDLKAKFKIKFSDFNITGISYLGVGVKDEAEISVVIPVVTKK